MAADPLELAPGEAVTLELPEVPTSGYRWRVVAGAGGDDDLLDLAASQTRPADAGRLGGQALRELELRAKTCGQSLLRLELRRPGNSLAPPDGVVEVPVTVR